MKLQAFAPPPPSLSPDLKATPTATPAQRSGNVEVSVAFQSTEESANKLFNSLYKGLSTTSDLYQKLIGFNTDGIIHNAPLDNEFIHPRLQIEKKPLVSEFTGSRSDQFVRTFEIAAVDEPSNVIRLENRLQYPTQALFFMTELLGSLKEELNKINKQTGFLGRGLGWCPPSIEGKINSFQFGFSDNTSHLTAPAESKVYSNLNEGIRGSASLTNANVLFEPQLAIPTNGDYKVLVFKQEGVSQNDFIKEALGGISTIIKNVLYPEN